MPRKRKTYPEHEKLQAVRSESQSCGEFLEWLEANDHVEVTSRKGVTTLLAEFFEIDEAKLEKEKRQMIDDMRDAQEKAEKRKPEGKKFEAWKRKLDKCFKETTGCTWADLCGDAKPLEQAYRYDEDPQEFVDAWVEKYDLEDIRSSW